MKLRKLVSLGLLSTLATTMVVPAFAADAVTNLTDDPTAIDGSELSTVVTGTTNIPAISVILQLEDQIILNPYGLTYEVHPESGAGAGDAVNSNDQIIHEMGVLQNKSAFAINVSCVANAEVGGDVILSEEVPTGTTIKEDTETKTVALTFTAAAVPNSTETNAVKTIMDAATPVAITANPEDFTPVVVEVDATVATAPTDDSSAAKQFLAYKIGGQASQTTTWTDADTVSANIAWTITAKPL